MSRSWARPRPLRSALLVALVTGLLTAGCTAADEPDPTSGNEAPTPEATASDEPRPRGAVPEPEATASPDADDADDADEHRAVVDALAAGGQVVYIRHAATEKVTEGADLDLDDPATQRNLSSEGRRQADAIGRAFTRLDVPVGAVVSSPYWRAQETARIAFDAHEIAVDDDLLYDEHPDADRSSLAEALREMLAEPPAAGTNTVLVGHGGNLQGAARVLIDEGATAVFTPRTDGDAELVGVVPADDWEGLG